MMINSFTKKKTKYIHENYLYLYEQLSIFMFYGFYFGKGIFRKEWPTIRLNKKIMIMMRRDNVAFSSIFYSFTQINNKNVLFSRRKKRHGSILSPPHILLHIYTSGDCSSIFFIYFLFFEPLETFFLLSFWSFSRVWNKEIYNQASWDVKNYNLKPVKKPLFKTKIT